MIKLKVIALTITCPTLPFYCSMSNNEDADNEYKQKCNWCNDQSKFEHNWYFCAEDTSINVDFTGDNADY